MELRQHRDLRDAGKRRLDHIDAHVEGREAEGLREPETDERANHEAAEKDERKVLVETDVAHPDRVDHDADEDQGEGRRDAAQILRRRENGARDLHVREDEGDGRQETAQGRRNDPFHRFLGKELRALRMRRLDAVHGFKEISHRPEIGRVREEVEERRHDRFVAEESDRNRQPDEHIICGSEGRCEDAVVDALNAGDLGDEK